MPNPDPEKKGEMITVQLVRKILQKREVPLEISGKILSQIHSLAVEGYALWT